MVKDPDSYVLALQRERAGYTRNPNMFHRVLCVDQELASRGWVVDVDNGDLVEIDQASLSVKPAQRDADRVARRATRERAVPKPSLETAVDKELPDEQQA